MWDSFFPACHRPRRPVIFTGGPTEELAHRLKRKSYSPKLASASSLVFTSSFLALVPLLLVWVVGALGVVVFSKLFQVFRHSALFL